MPHSALPFQSSPVPKDGCNLQALPTEAIALLVSILTRPEGRVQLSPASSGARRHKVSILTRPEGRVQHSRDKPKHLAIAFQSSPVPKDGCNCSFPARFSCTVSVSILTRPEGRVQLAGLAPQLGSRTVSILTRPEGRVQPVATAMHSATGTFQSSPVPKDGCNFRGRATPRACRRTFQSSPVPKDGCNPYRSLPVPHGYRFQSSPVPKDGCNGISMRTGKLASTFQSSPVPKDGCNATARFVCAGAHGFNPHPSRRTGATTSSLMPMVSTCVFQSSPVPKDGCNCMRRGARTRSCWFQSSPVPKDGCNWFTRSLTAWWWSFNPHPSRRTGATRDGCGAIVLRGFNPHPSRRTGATGKAMRPIPIRFLVSILTRPEGRVQRRTTAPNSTLQSNFPAPLPC